VGGEGLRVADSSFNPGFFVEMNAVYKTSKEIFTLFFLLVLPLVLRYYRIFETGLPQLLTSKPR